MKPDTIPRSRATVVGFVIASLLTSYAARAAPETALSAEQRWKTECSSCHIAYPAKLLSAPTWRRLMSSLDQHFGADASVDAASSAAIGAYLEQNGGRERRMAATLRITDTAWFQREHDELPSNVWKRPAVKSASNCAACHTGAENGDFRERNVRIPR
jgi:hypothetical protein